MRLTRLPQAAILAELAQPWDIRPDLWPLGVILKARMQGFGQEKPGAIPGGMTEKEAEAVLKLHLEKTGGSAQISIQDTAEVLRLPQEEVAALLRQVRAGNTEAASRAVRGMRKIKKRDVILALIAAAVIAIGAFAMLGIGVSMTKRPKSGLLRAGRRRNQGDQGSREAGKRRHRAEPG